MIPLESDVEFYTWLWITSSAIGHRPISGKPFSTFQMIPVESGVEFCTWLWITSSAIGVLRKYSQTAQFRWFEDVD